MACPPHGPFLVSQEPTSGGYFIVSRCAGCGAEASRTFVPQ